MNINLFMKLQPLILVSTQTYIFLLILTTEFERIQLKKTKARIWEKTKAY